MQPDLIERLEILLHYIEVHIPNARPFQSTLNDTLDALSPMLPDDVAEIIGHLQDLSRNPQSTPAVAAMMLERQGLSQASLSKIIAEQQQDIEDMETYGKELEVEIIVYRERIGELEARVKKLEAQKGQLERVNANARIFHREEVDHLNAVLNRLGDDVTDKEITTALAQINDGQAWIECTHVHGPYDMTRPNWWVDNLINLVIKARIEYAHNRGGESDL